MKLFMLILLLLLRCSVGLAQTPGLDMPAKDGMIKVAVVISEDANLMDLSGPWEVFSGTMLDNGTQHVMPFQLYTVAPAKVLLHTEGANRHGLAITPDYSFDDAPIPDIVVLGAQRGGAGMSAWLNKIHAEHRIIMSVCTGAYRLADSGLLNGKPATTHHWYFGDFAQRYPEVKLQREVRYVQDDPLIFSAGGLSSGIDLALHLVSNYFGAEQAQKTADYLEYQGTGWKTNRGIAEITTPISHQTWAGELAPGKALTLHLTITGASVAVTSDLPAQQVYGLATKVHDDGKTVHIEFPIAGHPASFTGHSSPETNTASGVFKQDGKSIPVTLKRLPEAG